MMTRIAIDALQVASTFSGVGRQALALGSQLRDPPPGVALEVRCAADVRDLLAEAFPPQTTFSTPIARSRPRWRRIVCQQLVAPLRDVRSTTLVCLGDQGPVWGRARVTLVLNDVRRLTQPETTGLLERAFYRFVVPRAARRAARLVTISEFSRGEIRRALGLEAELVQLRPAAAVDSPAREPGGHLLVVGALRGYKGVDTAITALSLVAPEERRPLVLVGPDEGAGARLRRLALAQGVADLVRFAGWVTSHELDRLRRAAAVAVCPSAYEGYGQTVAESLAYGLPTIASDIPAHREVAGPAALYFPPGDAPALAACLRRLDREGEALSLAALARSREPGPMRPGWRELVFESL